MGSKQSVQAKHFQRPSPPETDAAEEVPDDHHISISNKMVERLVEDATLTVEAAAADQTAALRGDHKDKICMERLKSLDETHSERTGLTIDDLNSLATRIDYRTSNMVSVEPVCVECEDRVIECYNQYELPEDSLNCSDIVAEFTWCVQAASAARARTRAARDARERARRARHLAPPHDGGGRSPRGDSAAA